LDDDLPAGAAHHQKIVVVDDAIAFCGGQDVTIRRWDTVQHNLGNPVRVDPTGKPCRRRRCARTCETGARALEVWCL
jgi:phospholipase D1/2